MKKIILILAVVAAFLFIGCDGTTYSDGYIDVTVTNLNLLTNFTQGQSDFGFNAFTKDANNNYTFVDGSASFVYDVSNTSVSFIAGVPDFLFTGGEVYYLRMWVDIDGDENFDEAGIDYISSSLYEVVIDGDEIVSFDNTDFVLR